MQNLRNWRTEGELMQRTPNWGEGVMRDCPNRAREGRQGGIGERQGEGGKVVGFKGRACWSGPFQV